MRVNISRNFTNFVKFLALTFALEALRGVWKSFYALFKWPGMPF
jgi:hypothetical protein